MMDFIYNLYQSDNFVLILTIALVVLILLFVIIFFWGKKDQKLEETKKLQKIELDSFKEKKEEPIKIETEKEVEKPLVIPDIVPVGDILTKEEKTKDSIDVTVTEFEPEKKITSEKQEENVSLFSESDSETDLKLEENVLADFAHIHEELEKVDIPDVEEKKEEVVEDSKEKKVFKPSEVFSSVYVNKEENVAPLSEQEASETEEEKEKAEVSIEEPKKDVSKLFMIEDDDEDMELPSLKK